MNFSLAKLYYTLLFICLFCASFTSLVEAREDIKKLGNDIYVLGENINIFDQIDGDVFLFADTYISQSSILGDLNAVGNYIDITNTIGGDVRLIGNEIVISAIIGESVLAIASNISIEGEINDDIYILADTFFLNSTINGDVHFWGGVITLSNDTKINGKLYANVKSESNVVIEEGAIIRDGESIVRNQRVKKSPISHIYYLIFFALLGLFAGWVFKVIKISKFQLREKFIFSLLSGLGFILFSVIFVIFAFLIPIPIFITLSIMFILLGFILLPLLFLPVVVGCIISAIFRIDLGTIYNSIIGAIVLYVFLYIPYMWFLFLILFIFVLGEFLRSIRENILKRKK